MTVQTHASTLGHEPVERRFGMRRGDHNENPKGISLVGLLREDFQTNGSRWLEPGFWALAVHRFGNWRMDLPKGLRASFTALYHAAHHLVVALWGIDLPYNAKIGRRFRIEHHGCVHIGSREIGDDVVVRNTATIGLLRRNEFEKPIIGNRVEVGPGACIVGGVHVGDDAVIGANSLVTSDVPEASMVLGVPAHIAHQKAHDP